MSSMLLAGSAAMGAGPRMVAPHEMQQGPTLNRANVTNQFAPTRADDGEMSIEFTYAEELYSALGFGSQNAPKNSYVYNAWQFDASDVAAFNGNKITAITVFSGVNKQQTGNQNTEAQVFISNSLTSGPVYTQDVTISSDAFKGTKVTLDTPYEIKSGETLVVGYRLKLNDPDGYYIPVDGVATSNVYVALAAVSTDGSYPKAMNEWTTYADQYGTLYMTVQITGTNLPQNQLALQEVQIPGCTSINSPVNCTMTIKNAGANPVSKFKINVEATGETAYSKEISLDGSMEFGKVYTVSAQLDAFTTTGAKDVKITITDVEGVANESTYNTATAPTVSIEGDKGFARRPVWEEGTGTWCGYCPYGIVQAEYLRDKYGDKISLIAYHTGDVMEVSSCEGWLNEFAAAGVPSAAVNRTLSMNPGYKTGFNELIDETLASKSYVSVELGDMTNVKFNSKDRWESADFEVKTKFALDFDNNFLISIALVQDEMGPYMQTNYFSGTNELPGWGDKPYKVSTVYDDVARGLSSFPGEDLLPAAVTAGEEYPVVITKDDMKRITKDTFKVIAMVTDAKTGEIVNACEKVYDKAEAGVKGIANNNVSVSVENGSISVSGASNVAIYNMSGVKVANGSASNLPAGIYVVKADGQVNKVIVK